MRDSQCDAATFFRRRPGASAPAGVQPGSALRSGGDKASRATWAVVAGVLGLVIAPLGTARAQVDGPESGDRSHARRIVPNVPDQQGCVMLCEFDLNPCDPPIFKREDGRCNPRR